MSDQAPDSDDTRKLLFISYAYEDQAFAKWLARKLAFYGYGVWFDQIKLLGGESWVEDVDLAIKDHSFRVLALLSKSSISKDHPRKERTMAQAVGKKLGIDDFLIPLNLDGTDPDWKVSDISWISCWDSWADGLRRLLKKLNSIEAPQIHEGNPAIAAVELSDGSELVASEPEELISNWIPFENLPEGLRIYDAPGLEKKDLRDWPCFSLGDGKVAALSDPPASLSDRVRKTMEVHAWRSVDEIRRSSTHSIIVQILNQAVRLWLKNAGCVHTYEAKVTHLPDPFREESIYRYEDADGTKRRISTSGKITVKKPSAPPEKVIHHPGVRYRARRIGVGDYVLELTPSVALFDIHHAPYAGKKIGPRRKKVSRGWYNPHWRKRLMVFVQLLKEQAAIDTGLGFGLGEPIRLLSDRSLISINAATPEEETAEDSSEEEIELGIDEMEEWQS